jgi:hypothetical protein
VLDKLVDNQVFKERAFHIMQIDLILVIDAQ